MSRRNERPGLLEALERVRDVRDAALQRLDLLVQVLEHLQQDDRLVGAHFTCALDLI